MGSAKPLPWLETALELLLKSTLQSFPQRATAKTAAQTPHQNGIKTPRRSPSLVTVSDHVASKLKFSASPVGTSLTAELLNIILKITPDII